MMYKVCGESGASAPTPRRPSQDAIGDGVNVINFSIGGGANPYSDPVELAFLDAYNAGVFVAASAGNNGPGADTTEHRAPWVTAVAAARPDRAFDRHRPLTADGGATLHRRVADPGRRARRSCSRRRRQRAVRALPRPAASPARSSSASAATPTAASHKGYNVLPGGAAGMILYNGTLARHQETDNHFLPAVPPRRSGSALVAFLAATPT